MNDTQNLKKIGDMAYHPEDIITFEAGLPGFETLTQFVISARDEHAPFHWLHSLDDPELRFIMINPMHVKADYDPRITKAHLNSIDVKAREDLLMYVFVTLNRNNFQQSTVNLLGPVLININSKKGLQLILDDQRYSTKASIMGGEAQC